MVSVDMSEYEKQGLLHEMFTRQAKATPDKVAVVSDGAETTFRELDEMTDVLATNLRCKGVKPNTIVGIYMERNLSYTVAYIAILKAGGAYMPMDISYPMSLLGAILADAKPMAVITVTDLVKNVSDANHIIVMDEDWMTRIKAENANFPAIIEPSGVKLDNMAYTVYSSGTTGKPKGIQCPHRGAVYSYHWRHLAHPYKSDEREACNIFFVWEMLRPLLRGVAMHIIPDSVIYDPPLLCQFLKKHSITRMLFTPSLLEAVLDTEGFDVPDCFKSMRTILFCGEVVTTVLLDRCMKLFPHVQFLNLYSVSECHDVACADLTEWYRKEKANITKRKYCPVGKLLPDVQVVILDENLKPQPVSVAGEIYVGGPTLGLGYLNRPEMTAKRFIKRPDSVSPKMGERLYKAGDCGYILSDGSLEIAGRLDTMVKIRGYSIEIAAVEATLNDLPMVNACVVVVMGEEGEDKYLVAYVVPEGQTCKKVIRAALKRFLPFYMIPSHFVLINSIPVLAASGKLDKRALPPIDDTGSDLDADGLPTTDTERALVDIWADILHQKSVDIQESFFDLGGHSLLAARVLSRVNEQCSVNLTVKDLFLNPTVFTMAREIDSRKNRDMARTPSPTRILDLTQEVACHDFTVINFDIQLRSFWRSMQYNVDRWQRGRVFLTGATGYLGAFILRDLLKTTKTDVFCLVRELPDMNGNDRIRQTLTQFDILAPRKETASDEQLALEHAFESRVKTIKGDVGLVNMGMKDDDYNYFTTEIDFIIHAAAYVNLVYPYEALRGTNVVGTQNVVIFACTSKIKPLHYISTDAVFPHGLKDCCEDADMSVYASQLTDGYAQSKWVAEQLVLRAMERGLPSAIYRLGNLSGDSVTAAWNPQDFTLLMIKACVQLGKVPELDWDVEFTPVDFVSSTIVSLTQKTMLALGKVFHIVNTQPINSKWLFEWISAYGFPLESIPFTEWTKCIEASGGNSVQRLVDSMATEAEYFANLSTYDNRVFQQVMKQVGIDYPKIDSSLLQTYFRNLMRKRILPRLRRNTYLDRPLDGQVAIVTGASSGIGSAIGLHLARSGAKVALAARRLEKLQDVKKMIDGEGGVAIAVKTDVMDRENVKELVRHTEFSLGPVDILVNNAGIMYYTNMANLMEGQWEHQIDLNCKGTVNGIGAVLPGMLDRGKGHIVNMSSDAGRKGFAGLAVYSGTKFFVEGMSQAMRQELAPKGIKVTCIQPGDVKTDLLSHTTDKEAKQQYDGSGSTTILDPEDVARAVVYAVTQPPFVAVNEILIEPREAPC